MKEIFVQGKTLPEAYHLALQTLYHQGEISDCADYNQKQRECSMTIYVEEPLAEPRISKLIIGGAADLYQYEQELLNGILNFRINHGWSYTYESRYHDQLPFIIEELKRNPSSRRAVMDIRDSKYDITNDSPACWQHAQYFIRNGKLDCCILFRSNDLPEAFYFNAWAMIRLQKKIANELGVGVGTYTHRANSMHCYEKDFKLLEGYIKGIERGDILTYEYDGFFDELMLETHDDLMKKIEQLRRNMEV